jgi:hypothetical protein
MHQPSIFAALLPMHVTAQWTSLASEWQNASTAWARARVPGASSQRRRKGFPSPSSCFPTSRCSPVKRRGTTPGHELATYIDMSAGLTIVNWCYPLDSLIHGLVMPMQHFSNYIIKSANYSHNQSNALYKATIHIIKHH